MIRATTKDSNGSQSRSAQLRLRQATSKNAGWNCQTESARASVVILRIHRGAHRLAPLPAFLCADVDELDEADGGYDSSTHRSRQLRGNPGSSPPQQTSFVAQNG